ncbi:MAG: glycoside hydrolase family 3 C-terminal domain-containing protein [Firmicutes bacterium]|nr:glycoside hydrolase family 3 C-terminal domain-containing protein [Bacillota bacterium]
MELGEIAEKADAILEVWFPGTEGGNAIADILVGDEYPSGRLTMSFPVTVGQIPVYYNALPTGRPKGDDNNPERFVSRYMDIPNAPLYPFGYGLTYTDFKYGNIGLSSEILTSEA